MKAFIKRVLLALNKAFSPRPVKFKQWGNERVNMPGTTERGKPGTIAPEQFEELTNLVENYGAKLLAAKVAKICSKRAEFLKHEYPNSAVAAAFNSTATKISSVVGGGTGSVSRESFDSLSELVDEYGPEVVTMKLAKIAKRSGDNTASEMLKRIFPRAS